MALSNEAKLRLRVAVAQPVSGDEISTALDLATSDVAVLENGVFDVASSSNSETTTTNGGAISVSKLLTNISSAGAETRTLAAPSATGRLKIIVQTVDGGDVTVAMTNIVGGRAANGDAASTTVTFSAVGQSLILMSAGSKWVYLGGSAVCT